MTRSARPRSRLPRALLALAAVAAAPAARADEAGPLPFLPYFAAEWADIARASVGSRGVTAATADGGVTFILGGRLAYDAGAAGTEPKLGSGAPGRDGAVRRAWIEPRVEFGNGFALSAQYDLSSATRPINDALASYKGAGPVIVAVGQFKEPFSIDQLQPNTSTLFTERSLLDTFAPGRDVGAIAGVHGERWTLAGGVFGGNANVGPAQNGLAGTARFTVAPILSADEVLHLAAAASYRALDRQGMALSFSDTPEDFLFKTSLVDTGPVRNADAVARFGLEVGYELNPFRLQSEVVRTVVSGAGAPDRTFTAAYAEGSWVIGGHQRAYRLLPRYASEYGVFQGIEVPDERRVSHGGTGLFEVAARVSAIDLDSGAVRGGRERDVTAGLNWYPDADIRFMADYVHAWAEPSSSRVTGMPVDADTFTGRIQIAW